MRQSILAEFNLDGDLPIACRADLDLIGFGLSRDQALGNSLKVRAEYAHTTDESFARGHSEILMCFLQRGMNLYQTEYFRNECGQKALENIRYVLGEMKSIAAYRSRP